jgi:transposase
MEEDKLIAANDCGDPLREGEIIGRLRVIRDDGAEWVMVSCITCRHRFIASRGALRSGVVQDCDDPSCTPYVSGMNKIHRLWKQAEKGQILHQKAQAEEKDRLLSGYCGTGLSIRQIAARFGLSTKEVFRLTVAWRTGKSAVQFLDFVGGHSKKAKKMRPTLHKELNMSQATYYRLLATVREAHPQIGEKEAIKRIKKLREKKRGDTAYGTPFSAIQLATQYHCSVKTIWRHGSRWKASGQRKDFLSYLNERGTSVAKRTRKKSASAANYCDSGFSAPQIALQFQCSEGAVWKHAHTWRRQGGGIKFMDYLKNHIRVPKKEQR